MRPMERGGGGERVRPWDKSDTRASVGLKMKGRGCREWEWENENGATRRKNIFFFFYH